MWIINKKIGSIKDGRITIEDIEFGKMQTRRIVFGEFKINE
jgi:hypothetical protein